MSRTAAILEGYVPAVDDVPRKTTPATAARTRPYDELAARLLPASEPRRVVAFGCVAKGEGVTTVVRCLAAALTRSGRTAQVLPSSSAPTSNMLILGAPILSQADTQADPLAAARASGDCVLVDCGSLESSIDLLQLAPKTDGIVLVVEAGRTGTDQIERAAERIREAGGRLLGVVLNKRRYPIPQWIYRAL